MKEVKQAVGKGLQAYILDRKRRSSMLIET